jgi:hypothetical protein
MIESALKVIFFSNTTAGCDLANKLNQQSFALDVPDHPTNLSCLTPEQINLCDSQICQQITDDELKTLYTGSSKIYLEHDPTTIKIALDLDPC